MTSKERHERAAAAAARAEATAVANRLRVVLTQRGTDGVGHQLCGIFSCQLPALIDGERYGYAPSVPTRIQHVDSGPGRDEVTAG